MTEDWNVAAGDRAKASLERIYRAVVAGDSLPTAAERKTDAEDHEIAKLLLITAASFDAILEGTDVPRPVLKQSILAMLVSMDHIAPLPPTYVTEADFQAKIEELRTELANRT
jgi:hypothetical protein